MTQDIFWKSFWMGSGVIMLVGLVAAFSLFAFYTRQGNLLAAVGVNFDPNKDPFDSPTIGAPGGAVGLGSTLSNGYFYQNALPIGFQSWTWSAVADWRSSEQKRAGTYALKAEFAAPGGTVGMSGGAIDTKNMKSISLSVMADAEVGDVYLMLYDKNGNSIGEQSLGWYASSTTLTPFVWQDMTIPLQNFNHGTVPDSVSGFSVVGKNPGIAYVDEVQLTKNEVAHDVWVAPPDTSGAPFNPFATSTPTALPYTFQSNSAALSKWYTYFGFFGPGGQGDIEIGPSLAASSTGSMTVFRGGSRWSDYHIDAAINWGEVSVFSLLSRFVDDGDFVSCAFSKYGEGAQIYQVTQGTSNLISQTPPLSVKDYEPWVDVKLGMEVEGNTVLCFVGGEQVLKATLTGLPSAGSAGIETWDPNPAAAPHSLLSFTVTQVSHD